MSTAPSCRLLLPILTLLLRFMGCVLLLAFPTILLPEAWMAATHEWLGLGEFPAATLTDYLTRSAAALYGMHGVLVLMVSTDVVRYRSLVTVLGAMNVAMGGVMLGIDLHADMPWWWTAIEGPPLMGMGVLILLLNRAAARNDRAPKELPA